MAKKDIRGYPSTISKGRRIAVKGGFLPSDIERWTQDEIEQYSAKLHLRDQEERMSEMERERLKDALKIRDDQFEDFIERAVHEMFYVKGTGYSPVSPTVSQWVKIGKKAVEEFGVTPREAAEEIFNNFYFVGFEEERITLEELTERIYRVSE